MSCRPRGTSDWRQALAFAALLLLLTSPLSADAAAVAAADEVADVTLSMTGATGTTDLRVAIPGIFSADFDDATYRAISYGDNATYTGLVAAFREANLAGGVHGLDVTPVAVNSYGGKTTIPQYERNMEAMIKIPRLVAIAGGFWTLVDKVTKVSKAGEVPVFGSQFIDPESYSAGARLMVHARAPFESEAILALRFATMSSLHCKHLLFFHLPIFGGRAAALRLRDVVLSMGLPEPTLVETKLARDPRHQEFRESILPLLDAMPQKPHAVFCMMDGQTAKFVVETFVKSPHFAVEDMFFFFPSFADTDHFADSEGNSNTMANVFLTLPFPQSEDARYTINGKYHAAIGALKAAIATDPTVSAVEGHVEGEHGSSMSQAGYVTGRLIVEALRRVPPGTMTGAALADIMYRTKTFSLDDMILGPYSDGCVGQQTNATGPCWCNSGAKQVFLSRVDGTTGHTDPVLDNGAVLEEGIAEAVIPLDQCHLPDELRRPSIAATIIESRFLSDIAPVDWRNTYGVALHSEITVVAKRNISAPEVDQLLSSCREFLVNGTTTGSERGFLVDASARALRDGAVTPNDFSDLVSRYRIFAIPMPSASAAALSGAQSLLRIAPIPADRRWQDRDDFFGPFADHDAALIPFFPTIADFTMLVARWAWVKRQQHSVYIVADSSILSNISRRAVHTFGSSESGAMQVDQQPEAGRLLSSDAAVHQAAAEAIIDRALTAAREATAAGERPLLMISTHQPILIRAVLRSTLRADRFAQAGGVVVLCASELILHDVTDAEIHTFLHPVPPIPEQYGADHTNASLIAEVVERVIAPNVFTASALRNYALGQHGNPLKAYGAVVGGLLAAALHLKVASDTPDAITKAVLATPAMTAAGYPIGPLVNVSCGLSTPTWPHPGSASSGALRLCQCRKGLSSFFVHNLKARLLDIRTPAVFFHRHSGCGVEYKPLPPPTATLSTAELAAIVAASVVFFLLVIGLAVAVVLCTRDNGRDVRHAPKDPNAPFAMVFTDIQASTAMWARVPSHMGDAVELHHSVLREVIAEHKGYEVKTIGDSFMVAFTSPRAALRFAMHAQTALYAADWGTREFDECYREMLLAKEGVDDAFLRQPPTAWRGIRVRIGVHFGDGNIKYNEVARSFDYYGDVVNTAARVEGVAHGGQVLVTHDAADALALDLGAAAEFDPEAQKELARTLGHPDPKKAMFTADEAHGQLSLATGPATVLAKAKKKIRIKGRKAGAMQSTDNADPMAIDPGIDLEWRSVIVTALGPQPLRGLDEDVELFQLVPRCFGGRLFPPLRLDVEIEVEMSSESDSSGSESASQMPSGLSVCDTASRPSGYASTMGSQGSHMSQGSWARLCTDPAGCALALLRRGGNPAKAGVLLPDAIVVNHALQSMLSTSTPKYSRDVLAHCASRWHIRKLPLKQRKVMEKALDSETAVSRMQLAVRIAQSVNAAGLLEAAKEQHRAAQRGDFQGWAFGRSTSSGVGGSTMNVLGGSAGVFATTQLGVGTRSSRDRTSLAGRPPQQNHRTSRHSGETANAEPEPGSANAQRKSPTDAGDSALQNTADPAGATVPPQPPLPTLPTNKDAAVASDKNILPSSPVNSPQNLRLLSGRPSSARDAPQSPKFSDPGGEFPVDTPHGAQKEAGAGTDPRRPSCSVAAAVLEEEHH